MLLSLNHFRETERDWDKDLAEDVKGECENKYGPVTTIKVEKETQVSTAWCFPDYSFEFSTAGRNICQIWHCWKRKKGHSRFKWSMVWRKTSLSSLYFWRHYASTSVGYSHGSGAGMHEETPHWNVFFSFKNRFVKEIFVWLPSFFYSMLLHLNVWNVQISLPRYRDCIHI